MNKNEILSFMAQERKKNSIGCLVKSNDHTDFTTGENGSISGYFATFDHDHGDSYGDVIRNGAFAGTIARRKKAGHPFPLCYGHDFNQIIGMVTDIGEDDKGAYFSADFFPTDRAQEIRSIVKAGALWQFSFAYDTLDSKKITAGDGSTVNELRELELYEISIVAIPANPRAVITDIKEYRRNSKHDLLLSIHEINQEQEATKAELLRTIKSFDSDLDQLKKQEAQALKDIEEAERSGDINRRNRRKKALDEIRRKISMLK